MPVDNKLPVSVSDILCVADSSDRRSSSSTPTPR